MSYLKTHHELLRQINKTLEFLNMDKQGFVSIKDLSGFKLDWHNFYSEPINKLESITINASNIALFNGENKSLEDFMTSGLAFTEKDFNEQNQHLNDLYSDQLTSEQSKEELFQALKISISPSIAYAFSLLSQMVHAKSIHELLFVHGTDNAILNAVRVDKSLVSHPLVSQRLSEAQLSGDSEFFGRLAMEINKPNFLSKVKYPRTYIAYHIFERDGLLVNGKLNPEFSYTYSDLLDALHEAGFFEGFGEGITEPKKLNTHIQTYFKLRTRHPV